MSVCEQAAYPYDVTGNFGNCARARVLEARSSAGCLLGYLLLSDNYIVDVCADPCFFGSGAGTALIGAAAASLLAQGQRQQTHIDIELDVRQANHAARVAESRQGV